MDQEIQAARNVLAMLTSERLSCLDQTPAGLDRLSRIPLDQLRKALLKAHSERQRLAIGATWAHRLAEAASTRGGMDAALFRFAQHLRSAGTSSATEPSRRPVLNLAAYEAFLRLLTPPRHLRNTPRPGDKGAPELWLAALGFKRIEWLALLDQVGRATRSPPRRSAPKPAPQVTYPKWLSFASPDRSSTRLALLAPWDPSSGDDVGDLADTARAAYRAFVAGDYATAANDARPIQNSLGATWGPTETAEGRALFAWLRAVPLLDAIEGVDSSTNHHVVSAVELLHRTSDAALEEAIEALLERLPPSPTGEHVADLDWAAHRYRLCRVLGHESALDDLSNSSKAALRALWRQAHPTLTFQDDSTIGVLTALDNAFGSAATQLQGQSPALGAETYRALIVLAAFCDRIERDVLESVKSACAALGSDSEAPRSMQVLGEIETLIDDAASEVRSSGSLLLQESCLPLLDHAASRTSDLIDRLSSEGGPDLTAHLLTDKLPLLQASDVYFDVDFIIRNDGAMAARNVAIQTTSSAQLSFAQEANVAGDIPAGGERRVSLVASISAPARQASFVTQVTWDDDYEREGAREFEHFTEAQRESKWTPADRNPYQLSSIEDPERLIGRAEYIQQYLDIARSGGSMYVTGLKRVGKTSLVRVALTLLQREEQLTVYLPRGRAFGPDASAADLVIRMLEKLEDAATEAFPELDMPSLDAAGDNSNYSRLADRWLGRLHRVLPPGTMVMIALDDFDELPANLRSGEDADALFLFLRTLIDESWISITFIGSEVLPTLLAQQSHRLNQVDPIEVNNFGSRESTGELLRVPSSDRVDWTDEAVDLVHALTEGNPYYATILGGRIWTALRERDRTLAQEADVDAAANRLGASENQSHFMHLWSDDPEGLDAASPKAIRSSAVLRALARCSTTPGSLVDRSEVIAVSQQWIAGSTTELLQEACSSLIRRGIVHEADAGQLRLRLPIVGMWLQAAGGRHLDEVYRESSLAKPAAKVVTAGDYRQLARNLTYRSQPVNTIDLEGWVTQLPDPTHQYLAFQLLRRACTTGYFSQQRVMTEVVPALAKALREGPLLGREERAPNNYLTRVLVLDPGPAGSSAPMLVRPMLSTLRIAKAAVTPLDEIGARAADEAPLVILVLDEFAGSGRQIRRVVESLVAALGAENERWQDATTIGVGIGVVPGADAALSLSELPCEVAVGVTIGSEVRAFDPAAEVFDTDSDREAARDLMSAIGRSLGARPPLGFADQGLVVVFESNCPNNSLPALWKNGDYSGRPWLPLFERMESRDFGVHESSVT